MDDREICERFTQLRESDREMAPSFARTYARARMRRSVGAMLTVRPLVIGAAAAVVLVAVWLANGRPSSAHTATTPIAAIAAWRAPSDVLLRTPGDELLGEMPALGASVLDKMIQTSTNRGT